MKFSVPLSILLGGAIIGHEVRISRIEESRFTSTEAMRLQAQVKDYADRTFVAAPWLRESMERMERKIDVTATKVDALSGRVSRLED